MFQGNGVRVKRRTCSKKQLCLVHALVSTILVQRTHISLSPNSLKKLTIVDLFLKNFLVDVAGAETYTCRHRL